MIPNLESIERSIAAIRKKGGVILTTNKEMAGVLSKTLNMVEYRDIVDNTDRGAYIMDDADQNKQVDYFVYLTPEQETLISQELRSRLYSL